MGGIERCVWAGARRLRCGYTTGSSAALAAGAATRLLLSGAAPSVAHLIAPSGDRVCADVLEPHAWTDGHGRRHARCAVRKDGGDDADATDGLLVFATVREADAPAGESQAGGGDSGGRVTILGGEGVGIVTKPGLEQPVGAPAINSVPRSMIRAQVERACEEAEFRRAGIEVVISVPGGAEAAARTFNGALGIVGGISILGTTGIVEPRSVAALRDSIELEVHQKAALGHRDLVIVPGAYGDAFVKARAELAELPRVSCANFIGATLDCAAREGFARVLLVGHLGKLVKVAGGIMYTHSQVADARCEIMCAHAAMAGIGPAAARELMACATTDSCLDVVEREGVLAQVVASLVDAIGGHVARRVGDACETGVIVFTKARGELGRSAHAGALIEAMRKSEADVVEAS